MEMYHDVSKGGPGSSSHNFKWLLTVEVWRSSRPKNHQKGPGVQNKHPTNSWIFQTEDSVSLLFGPHWHVPKAHISSYISNISSKVPCMDWDFQCCLLMFKIWSKSIWSHLEACYYTLTKGFSMTFPSFPWLLSQYVSLVAGITSSKLLVYDVFRSIVVLPIFGHEVQIQPPCNIGFTCHDS